MLRSFSLDPTVQGQHKDWAEQQRLHGHITIYNRKRVLIDCRASNTSDNYFAWARAAGIQVTKVKQEMIEGVRGMRAIEAIDAGEIFVNLPRHAALVVDPLEKCPCMTFVDGSWYKKAPWYVKMAVLLLWERQKGISSRVNGYISQLPRSIDTPVRWDEDELKELQNVTLIESICKQRVEWMKWFEEFKEASQNLQGGGNVTWEDFVWALENVQSRSFSGPYAGSPIKERLSMAGLLAGAGLGYALVAKIPLESVANAAVAAASFNLIYDIILSNRLKWYAMCPIIDSLNHKGHVESSIEYEYFKDTFVVSTASSYQTGEEVFISYGAKTNDQLVQYYGFIEDQNPHDLYKLEIHVASGTSVMVSVKPNGQLSTESLDMIAHDGGIQELFKDTVGKGKISDAVNDSLVEALEKELKSKETSLEDDERLLQNPGLIQGPRQRLAIQYRVLQKKTLRNALKLSKKRSKM